MGHTDVAQRRSCCTGIRLGVALYAEWAACRFAGGEARSPVGLTDKGVKWHLVS